MPFHCLVRFDALPGKAVEFREELLRAEGLSRSEKDCLSIRAFQSMRRPAAFGIYSEWVDETSFDLHAQMPHAVRFVAAARD